MIFWVIQAGGSTSLRDLTSSPVFLRSSRADRHWEHGEDLSLLRRTPTFGEGVGKMVRASAKVRAKIRSVGVREMMRRTKQSQHTIERIVRGERVRARTLQRVIEALK